MQNATITKRELHLQLVEIENTLGAFKFAAMLMNALKMDIITNDQYDMFSGDLYYHCLKNNIRTTNECVSLF